MDKPLIPLIANHMTDNKMEQLRRIINWSWKKIGIYLLLFLFWVLPGLSILFLVYFFVSRVNSSTPTTIRWWTFRTELITSPNSTLLHRKIENSKLFDAPKTETLPYDCTKNATDAGHRFTFSPKHTHTETRTHTNTHIHTHSQTHTHTHTHTQTDT